MWAVRACSRQPVRVVWAASLPRGCLHPQSLQKSSMLSPSSSHTLTLHSSPRSVCMCCLSCEGGKLTQQFQACCPQLPMNCLCKCHSACWHKYIWVMSTCMYHATSRSHTLVGRSHRVHCTLVPAVCCSTIQPRTPLPPLHPPTPGICCSSRLCHPR